MSIMFNKKSEELKRLTPISESVATSSATEEECSRSVSPSIKIPTSPKEFKPIKLAFSFKEKLPCDESIISLDNMPEPCRESRHGSTSPFLNYLLLEKYLTFKPPTIALTEMKKAVTDEIKERLRDFDTPNDESDLNERTDDEEDLIFPFETQPSKPSP